MNEDSKQFVIELLADQVEDESGKCTADFFYGYMRAVKDLKNPKKKAVMNLYATLLDEKEDKQNAKTDIV